MPNAFTNSADEPSGGAPIYLANLSDLRETDRAIGISMLGVEPAGPAIFRVDSEKDLRESWDRWLSDTFEARLGKPFVDIFLAAGEMRNRRIAERDRLIDACLSEEARRRSLSAAPLFFEGTSEIKRLPQWTRFLAKIEDGTTPGHVISLFALRSAVFHLPLLPALVSYLYYEWRSAAQAVSDGPLSPEIFQTGFPEGIETAKRVFNAGSGVNRLESI